MEQSIERSSVSDQVFRILCRDVLSGRYAPGELLPTQRALAADLGVNMTGVREAIKRLEQMRLVESRQGEGMRVLDWRAHGGLDVVAHMVMGSGGAELGTLEATLEARRLMLQEAARLAAQRRTKPQAQRLLELSTTIADTDDAATAQLLDLAFFTEVVEAAGNIVFTLILNSMRQLYLERAEVFRAVTGEPQALAPLYVRAAGAIELQDARAAADAVAELAGIQEQALIEAARATPGAKR